jgi:serine/threonine protein kinase
MPRVAPGSRSSSAATLSPGEWVPGTRIRIVERLARGAVGDIYRGIHADLERPVALKILREVPDHLEEVEHFRREAVCTTRIDSPYVVDVLDFGTLPDGRPFYAMPWLGATALDTVIARGPLPPDRVIGLLRMACKGLAAAHAAGITHRDVKPENLMLVDVDRKQRLVVVDFGLAIRTGTVPEVHGGTPTYMSPEQILGLPIDERADIYALGCVAYEMLAGHPPFVAPTVTSLLRQHADCDPQPLSRLCAKPLPEGLEPVVLRCLEKSRTQRFSSMAELEASLCELQIAAGIQTPWDPLPPPDVAPRRRSALGARLYAPRSMLSRHRRAALVAVLVGLVGTVPLLPLDVSITAVPKHASPSTEPPAALHRDIEDPAVELDPLDVEVDGLPAVSAAPPSSEVAAGR